MTDYANFFGKVLKDFNEIMVPYIIESFKKEYGSSYMEKIKENVTFKESLEIDTQAIITIIIKAWDTIFSKTQHFVSYHRTLVF